MDNNKEPIQKGNLVFDPGDIEEHGWACGLYRVTEVVGEGTLCSIKLRRKLREGKTMNGIQGVKDIIKVPEEFLTLDAEVVKLHLSILGYSFGDSSDES